MSGRQGFTLIELMTVVAIIAVLAAIGIPGMIRYRASGQAAKCVSNLRAIQVAREAFVADFPPANSRLEWNNIARYFGDAAGKAPCVRPVCPVGGSYTWEGALTEVGIPPKCPNYTANTELYGGHTLGWTTYVAPTP